MAAVVVAGVAAQRGEGCLHVQAAVLGQHAPLACSSTMRLVKRGLQRDRVLSWTVAGGFRS
jgi:hypothetical protein